MSVLLSVVGIKNNVSLIEEIQYSKNPRIRT